VAAPGEYERERLLPDVVSLSAAAGRRRESPPTLLAPQAILSVGQLTHTIKQLLEGSPAFQQVRVQGEIGPDYRGPASSGHHYFNLKDADAQISCVIWASTAASLRVRFNAGDAVILTGDLRVYAPRGSYQLSVTDFERAGQGAAWLQFLELKAKLESEGLFAPELKKPIPTFPRCIGIVTSANAAALKDILRILRNRAPHIPVRIAEALVQGPLAASAIQQALWALEQEPEVDVILLARGGGSYEDLACFNDESLVRAIARMETPIITGVGHETDYTLVDFVSDLRASTPTRAASDATPDGPLLRGEIEALLGDINDALYRRITQLGMDIDALLARPAMARPGRELEDRRQHVDELVGRAVQHTRRRLTFHQDQLEHLAERQVLAAPYAQWHSRGMAADQLVARVERAMMWSLQRRESTLARIGGILQESHPTRLLARGFALIRDAAGRFVTGVSELRPSQALTIQLRDGAVPVQVTGPSIIDSSPLDSSKERASS